MKRFTETEKWRDTWFRALDAECKLAWLYICDTCDKVGVWDPDFALADFCIGTKVDWEKVKTALAKRLEILPDRKWFVVPFIGFQYGCLSPRNPLHKSVLSALEEHKLPETIQALVRPYLGPPRGPQEEEEVREGKRSSASERGSGGKPSGLPRSETEAVEWAGMQAVPALFASQVYHEMEGIGWIDGAQRQVTNWRSYVAARYSKQKKAENDGGNHQANGSETNPKGFRGVNRSGSAGSVAYALETQKRAIQERLAQLAQAATSGPNGLIYTLEAKSERYDLKEKMKDIDRRLRELT